MKITLTRFTQTPFPCSAARPTNVSSAVAGDNITTAVAISEILCPR